MSDSHHIDRSAAAYLLDCDVRTLTTYQGQESDPLPVAVRGKRGQSHRYDPQALVKWKIRQELAKASSNKSALDLDAERARLAAAQADKAELDHLIRSQKYAPIEILTFAIADFARQAIAILEAIPKRVKNSLPTLRARELKIIEREINNARLAASQIQINFDRAR